MKYRTLRLSLLTLTATSLILGSQASAADPVSTAQESKSSSPLIVGVGPSYPTFMGDETNLYNPALGFEAEMVGFLPGLLGDHLNLRASFQYQPLPVKGLPTATISQWNGFVGIETKSQSNFFIQPVFAAEIGSQFTWLAFRTPGSLDNSRAALAARIRPGIRIPVWSRLDMTLSMPLHMGFNSNRFTMLGSVASMRFAL